MKKEAWPWTGSDEMGSMSPTGDLHRDMQGVPHGGYDTLSPSKYLHDGAIPESGAEGMRFLASPTLLDIEDEESEALRAMVEQVRSYLEPDMTLGFSGDAGDKLSLAFDDADVNLVGLTKNSSSASSRSYTVSSNPMFYKFPQRLNGFVLDLSGFDKSSSPIVINNFAEQLAFNARGIVISSPDRCIESDLKKAGLSIVSSHSGLFSKHLVSNDLSRKLIVAKYYDKRDEESASFLCDIADTLEKKIDGLQVYSKLKDNCGLLFPYKRATDVMFHMGSVSYPIDIIFIDENSQVKKISKSIQPGSVEVFSCSGVKDVLEVPGGMCDLLNVKVGGFMYTSKVGDHIGDLQKTGGMMADLGMKRFAIKSSECSNPAVYLDKSKSIIRIGSGQAPSADSVFRKFASKNNFKNNKVIALDADNFLSTLGAVKLYEHCPPKQGQRIYRGLFGETFSRKSERYVELPLELVLSGNNYNKINKKYSLSTSDILNANITDSHKKILKKIASTEYTRVVFASREDLNTHMVEVFLEAMINRSLNKFASINAERLLVPSSFGSKSIYAAAESRYGDVELCSVNLVKEAGIPVPTQVQDKAKKCLKYLDSSSEMCKALLNNFNKNIEVYKKVEGQDDVIKGSKGKYNQSCKRNARITKRMLLSIKSAIGILSEIRDVSTTSEIISSIATAAKVSSSSIEDIFSLIEVIDSSDFIEKLDDSTNKSTSALDDMILALDRAKEYINSNILGILVITE